MTDGIDLGYAKYSLVLDSTYVLENSSSHSLHIQKKYMFVPYRTYYMLGTYLFLIRVVEEFHESMKHTGTVPYRTVPYHTYLRNVTIF